MRRTIRLLALAAAVAAAPAGATLGPGVSSRSAPSAVAFPSPRAGAARTSRTFRLDSGPARRHFTMRESYGVVVLTRITVPHGVRAYVDGRIPHVAGVRFGTAGPRRNPVLQCRRAGPFDVCTQQQERCPMPAAAWRMRLVKESGPAGPIRVEFVVAPPPSQR